MDEVQYIRVYLLEPDLISFDTETLAGVNLLDFALTFIERESLVTNSAVL